MTKNNLIYQLMKNSSKEMQQLLSEQFGFISESQVGNSLQKTLNTKPQKPNSATKDSLTNLLNEPEAMSAARELANIPQSPLDQAVNQIVETSKPEKLKDLNKSKPDAAKPDVAKPEPTPGENIGLGESGLTYKQWLVYFREANRSVSEARKTAMERGSQKKVQYSIEYAKKVQALRSQLEQLVREIKSTYTGYNPDTTLIPESMLTEGVGAGVGADEEDLGRPQKGKKGKGGAAGDEGADFYSASNENRRFDLAPFGPFMDLSSIKDAGLISNTQLYIRVKNVFGTDVDIDSFSSMEDALPEMKSLKGKDKYNNAPEFIQNLLDLMVDIQTQWQKKRRKNLPSEYKAEQGRQASEWKRKLESLVKYFQQDIREKKESLIAPSAPGKYAK